MSKFISVQDQYPEIGTHCELIMKMESGNRELDGKTWHGAAIYHGDGQWISHSGGPYRPDLTVVGWRIDQGELVKNVANKLLQVKQESNETNQA